MKAQYIDKGKFKHLYAVMQYENVLALRVALETGMRIGDVLALRVENLRARTISYVAQKTGKRDKKVIDTHTADELRRNASNGWLFPGRDPKKHRTRQAVYSDLRKACAVLGVSEHVTPHSTRKIMAVDYFREHGLTETQKALQHDRADTTMIYAFADLVDRNTRKTAESELKWDSIDALCRKIAMYVVEYLANRGIVGR